MERVAVPHAHARAADVVRAGSAGVRAQPGRARGLEAAAAGGARRSPTRRAGGGTVRRDAAGPPRPAARAGRDLGGAEAARDEAVTGATSGSAPRARCSGRWATQP